MKICLLTHPAWMSSVSMPRFADMIHDAMIDRGHSIRCITAPARLQNWPPLKRFGTRSTVAKKWLGYADQFILYRRHLRRIVTQSSHDTLFVVTDQALGMWVPMLADRPHIIHCHDFLALRSAHGEFDQNPTGRSGQIYQSLIQRGFSRGQHFICVSHRSQEDLVRFLPRKPKTSVVIHNGLNGDFRRLPTAEVEKELEEIIRPGEETGVLMHIGGNQWYKNRCGVIEIYHQLCRLEGPPPPPLWMVGETPTRSLKSLADQTPDGGQVRFVEGLSNRQVRAAYNLARLLIFPSLEEGFGWPIAESMACGTPVLTTSASPMTEVGGDAALYHRRRSAKDDSWASDGAAELARILRWSEGKRSLTIQKGFGRAAELSTDRALDAYEEIYKQVLKSSLSRQGFKNN